MDNKEFSFNYRINEKINIRNLELLDFKKIYNMSFEEMIPLIYEIAYIDISNDEEIQGTEESHKLHKICQYIIQYLIFSIEGLNNNNNLLEEDILYNEKNIKEMEKLLEKQTQEEDKLNNLLENYEEKINNYKMLINNSKNESNDESVNFLIKKLVKQREIELMEENQKLEENNINKSNYEEIKDIDNSLDIKGKEKIKSIME